MISSAFSNNIPKYYQLLKKVFLIIIVVAIPQHQKTNFFIKMLSKRVNNVCDSTIVNKTQITNI